MKEIIDALMIAFDEKGKGNTQLPPKPGIFPGPKDSFIHAMPAHIPALKSSGIKWVSAFPANPEKGLPYISGLIVVNDSDTGLPLAVMDAGWITAKRTGAASAVSARFLARPESSVMGVLGCGVQGRSHLEAMKTVFPITTCMAYDLNPDARKAYKADMEKLLDVEVIPVDAPKEAVSGCHIVVTAGPILKSPHKTIKAGWLDPGAFASLVDFDSYWDPKAIHEADKFCTDDTAQYMYYKNDCGYFQDTPDIWADLGELAVGGKKGRETAEEKTMTANLGLAIDDMAVAPLVFKRAMENNIGVLLPL